MRQAGDTFDPEAHIYRRDGIYVPSCTQVLSFYGITKEGPEGPREHARVRGDAVHRMIEDTESGENMGRDIEIPEGCTVDEIFSRYEAYLLFRREVPIKNLVLEYWRIAETGRFAYGVTPDIVCSMEGRPCVIECKNTYSPEKTHPIQTAAQVLACYSPASVIPEEWLRFALYLKGDGKYKLKAHTDYRDFSAWGRMLAGHEEARRLRGDKIWSPV
jgi:hypothetical protein